MPFYEFECDKCGKVLENFWSISNFMQFTYSKGGNTYMKTNCDCGGEFRNMIKNINLGPDIYKNDPTSNQYWKNGKSVKQVAGILSDDNIPPY